MNALLQRIRASGTAHRTIAAMLSAAALLASWAPTAGAQVITGRFVTSATSWEKFDTVGVSHKLFRAFQSAIFDVGQGNFTLHTNMQVAGTSADPISEDTDYRLYSLFGRMKNIAGALDVSLGRIPFFHGVGMGTLDGTLLTLRTSGNTARVTLYGGAAVTPDYGVHAYGTLKDKFVLGGQAVVHAVPNLRGSLSFINRRAPRPSYYALRVDPATLDASTMFIVPEPDREQVGGVDLSYTRNALTVYGRYDHDFAEGKTQRGQLGARYVINPDLLVTIDAMRREPRVPAGSFFSRFTLKGVTEIETGVDYFVLPGLRTFLRGAFVGYQGETSVRYSAGIGRNDISLTIRGNTGYAGELTSISLQGAYPLLDNRVVPNAGLSYMSYRVEKESARLNATSAVLGATLRPHQSISLDLQGQWMNNFVVKSDFRFLGRLHFWFSERLNLFE